MTAQKEQELVTNWLQNLEKLALANGFKVIRWGTSETFPLLGLIRHTDNTPRFYLSAGIHGDEPAGPLAIEHLLRHRLLDPKISWTICPLLNPGGWLAGTRENPHGIDINRDYLSLRSTEAAAHCSWINAIGNHDLYLSLHEDWETTGFYLYEINTSSMTPFAEKILEKTTAVMPTEPLTRIDDHIVRAPGYICHAPAPDDPLCWPEAIYHCRRYPHLSYTFETPSSLPIEQRVLAQVTATLAATEAFLSA